MIYHGQIRKQITKTKQIQEYDAKKVMSGELKTIFQNGFIFSHKTCFARFHNKNTVRLRVLLSMKHNIHPRKPPETTRSGV